MQASFSLTIFSMWAESWVVLCSMPQFRDSVSFHGVAQPPSRALACSFSSSTAGYREGWFRMLEFTLSEKVEKLH